MYGMKSEEVLSIKKYGKCWINKFSYSLSQILLKFVVKDIIALSQYQITFIQLYEKKSFVVIFLPFYKEIHSKHLNFFIYHFWFTLQYTYVPVSFVTSKKKGPRPKWTLYKQEFVSVVLEFILMSVVVCSAPQANSSLCRRLEKILKRPEFQFPTLFNMAGQ